MDLEFIRIVLSGCRHAFLVLSEELAVVFGDGELGGAGIEGLEDGVVGHVVARPHRLPHIEMLLHTLVADFVILVKSVEEGVGAFGLAHLRRLHLTFVGNGLFDEVIVLGAWRHLLGPHLRKIRLLPKSHGFLVHGVVVSGFFYQILDWQLLMHFCNTRGQLEALVFALGEIEAFVVGVVVFDVVFCRRRRLR